MSKLKKQVEEKSESLTVKQAAEAYAAIEALLESDKENKFIFASAVRCKLALNLRKTKPVAEEFMKENNRLVEVYGEKEFAPNPAGGEAIPTGRNQIRADSPNWEKFRVEYKEMAESDSEITLSPVKPYELAGVTEIEFNDPKADPKKQNQIATQVFSILYDTGLLTE